ncbi:MAG: Gfo/Idh/MocA family oxidoreductase [Steroidobacteraceae bacterium]
MKLGIAGLGWWGGTLVDAVEGSPNLKFVAAYTRSRSQQDQDIAAKHHLKLVDSYEAMLADPEVEGVVLATPPPGHADQIVAAAKAGKHVFCEKPFVMSKADANRAVAAVKAAGVTLGLGYNRRFHPSWLDLKQRIASGELGTILHAECTMSGPNGLTLSENAWRRSAEQAPLGGLFPMGVHAVDGFIDLFGEVDNVFCQSFRRAVPGENDDTTSVLFRMKQGMSAYLGTMMATAGTFRFQVYGSKAMALLGGTTHVAGQSSQHRRSGLFGAYVIQPIKGDALSLDVPVFDVNNAELEAFAQAATGGAPYPISHAEMIHGVAVTDAIIASARSSKLEHVA